MEPGFKTQLVTSLRSPGRGHARDIAGPREDEGCMRFWEPDLELGEEAREEDAMTDGAGRGPCAGCVQAPHLWTMAMRQKMRANRMDNSAVQAMLPSRRLLTSRRRGECRCPERIECDNSASVSAVESVVQALVPSQGLVNVARKRGLEVRHLLRNIQK